MHVIRLHNFFFDRSARVPELAISSAAKLWSSSILIGCVLAACGGGGSSPSAPIAPIAPIAPSVPSAPPLTPIESPVAITPPLVLGPTIAAGNWVVMGSSTAAGLGASSGKGWASLLSTAWDGKGGAVLLNIAKPGANTYDALPADSKPVAGRPLPDRAINIDQALSRKPVLLIVAFPTNDIAYGYSVDEIVANLMTIRARALSASVPVIVTSTQPRALTSSQLQQLQQIDEQMAKNVGACFVPVREKLAGPDGRLLPSLNSGDGIHPNDAGHLIIADAISALLRSGACVRFGS